MLPPALATDLAILRLNGGTVDDCGDHLVVRNPGNPSHHWGNFVVVTDPAALDDAGRWVDTFARNFPEADWVAIGLPELPSDRAAWSSLGLELELLDALTSSELPRRAPAVPGYEVRRLTGPDWELQLARAIEDNAASGRHPAAAFADYAERRTRQRRELCERGTAAWFGAFCGSDLVAELGIVDCGGTARYQDVGTDPAHRRKGLAGHLLWVAAQWAAAQGCVEWVIVTEATNEAGRLYRKAGFGPAPASVEAYRTG